MICEHSYLYKRWRGKIQGVRKNLKILKLKIKTDYPLIKYRKTDIIEVKEK